MTTEATLSEATSGSIPTSAPTVWNALRDIFSLAKPRLASQVVFTAAGAMWLAPRTPSVVTHPWVSLLATSLAVGAANALNCYLERDLDRHMARTRQRPLPAGRMNPTTALVMGLLLTAVSVPLLWFVVNPLTGFLGALAIASYVLVYTPMKTRSPAAMIIGGLPGALPPLMGWTTITGTLSLAGLSLFAVLFFWQMPHFLAIAIYRQDEYAAAGMKVMTLSRSHAAIRWQILAWTCALVPVTLSLTFLGVAGWAYFACAAALGAGFLGYALAGFRAANPRRWGRQVFAYSLVYVTGIFLALALDALRR